MTKQPPESTREERLAARLRDNLRRRRDQARVLSQGAAGPPPVRPALPKDDPKS